MKLLRRTTTTPQPPLADVLRTYIAATASHTFDVARLDMLTSQLEQAATGNSWLSSTTRAYLTARENGNRHVANRLLAQLADTIGYRAAA